MKYNEFVEPIRSTHRWFFYLKKKEFKSFLLKADDFFGKPYSGIRIENKYNDRDTRSEIYFGTLKELAMYDNFKTKEDTYKYREKDGMIEEGGGVYFRSCEDDPGKYIHMSIHTNNGDYRVIISNPTRWEKNDKKISEFVDLILYDTDFELEKE